MFKRLKIYLLVLALTFCSTTPVFAVQAPWVNDLRKLFLTNSANIYELNIRTFNAKDLNGNGIIEFELGEESGTFINAIERLDELKNANINTIHVQPITPVGKTKALGTAGSLYAAASFNTLNPQLDDKKVNLSLENQAKKFINEAHRRNIRVIIDLPACGAYDLYLRQPELFVKDKNGKPVIPADWTDVRILNGGSEENINRGVYNLYKEFVDMAIDLGVDGIRADVAPLKPAKFWKELISYSRKNDPQFMWLAETSDSWQGPISPEYNVYTPYNKLLEAGFDGYYGSWFNLKDWKTAKDLYKTVKFNQTLRTKYSEPKAVIGSFTTHDEVSPLLINGEAFSEMIIWLNATLPLNAYYLDGMQTGDNYIYFWANKKAPKTYTDDEYYFVHRGKIDIFNFSRKPGSTNGLLKDEFVMANSFRNAMKSVISSGTFLPLSTSNPEIFAYAMSHENKTIIVFGNINFSNPNSGMVKVPRYTGKEITIPIRIKSVPIYEKHKFNLKLSPGEIQVLMIDDFTPAK